MIGFNSLHYEPRDPPIGPTVRGVRSPALEVFEVSCICWRLLGKEIDHYRLTLAKTL